MATMPPPQMIAQLLQRLGSAGGPGGPPGGPGGPPGGPGGPGGPPPGGAAPDLGALQGMAAGPSPGGEANAMKSAMDAIGFAMSRFQMRAPAVAKELATALVHIKKAMDQSATLPAEPVAAPPPNMPAGGGMMGGDMGGAGMPPLGV